MCEGVSPREKPNFSRRAWSLLDIVNIVNYFGGNVTRSFLCSSRFICDDHISAKKHNFQEVFPTPIGHDITIGCDDAAGNKRPLTQFMSRAKLGYRPSRCPHSLNN